MSNPNRYARAPQLNRRRLARSYFFPWMQVPAGFIFVVVGHSLGTSWLQLVVWSICFGLCVIVQDMIRPYSRVVRFWYWLLGEKLYLARWQYMPDPNKFQQYNSHPPPILLPYRYHIGWAVTLSSLLLIWGAVVVQSHLYVTTVDEIVGQVFLVCSLLAFGIVPFGLTTARLMSHLRRRVRLAIWYGLAGVGTTVTFYSLYQLPGGMALPFLGAVLYLLLYAAVFVNQRIWVGQQALGEVVREVGLTFISWPETSQNVEEIPVLIGERLRHDRVFILMTIPEDPGHLMVQGQHGDYPFITGERVPIGDSLTGQALQNRQTIAWNNVELCPYYHKVHPEDDTKAEIAVPIIHNGVVHGILDVQSRYRNVYGPGDVYLLEMIAHILGVAMAIDKRDFFFDKAVVLLETVGQELPRRHQSEIDLVRPLATFAQNVLGVDQVVYFPLSLTGVPMNQPYLFWQKEASAEVAYQFPNSFLNKLIASWQPVFPNTDEETTTVQQALWSQEIMRRQGISSSCFIPVGFLQEPSGAIFLNFTSPKQFDNRFKFTVLSLAQSLAKATSQLRYRQVLVDGIGRPELGLHEMIGRQGLKEGVTHIAQALHSRCYADCCTKLEDCPYNELFSTMDSFLQQVSMAESSIPPNFWRNDFLERLQHHINDRPSRPDGRRPNILTHDIDPTIERENPWVKLTLYRLVTEAINNAIFHGCAANIWIAIRRFADEIQVEVTNDGKPLPTHAEENQSQYGIYYLLEECRQKLGATTSITIGHNGKGTAVFLTFPTLPERTGAADTDYFD